MLGEVGRMILAAIWRHDRHESMQWYIDLLKARIAGVQAKLRDAEEREAGLVWQFDKLLSEIENERRVEQAPLAAIAIPMNRLRSMRRHTITTERSR